MKGMRLDKVGYDAQHRIDFKMYDCSEIMNGMTVEVIEYETKGQYQKQKMGKVYYSKDSKTFIGNHSFNEPPYDNLIKFFDCKFNESIGECLSKNLESIGYKDFKRIEEFIKCLTK